MSDQLAYGLVEAGQKIGGASESTMRRLIAESQIVAHKLGRRTVIKHTELERYIATLPERD